MQPKERRETGEQDLFRSRLDQIIDLLDRNRWHFSAQIQLKRTFFTGD